MESKWEESLGLVTRKDFLEEKQLVTLRAQHQMAGCAQHVNLQRLMPRTDVHWAVKYLCQANRHNTYVQMSAYRRYGGL
ncbi:hypothetical protein NDU88_007002 [Pleurodeles waltl]|uniref:Uncharacterized protein n=1 Tax=Pleurodeles waltl TaxID=8319 RepID=A0AAV7N2T4_PLEWA|nr:hypothetical protein NDU88_007002 [Pleurodeles waltl]